MSSCCFPAVIFSINVGLWEQAGRYTQKKVDKRAKQSKGTLKNKKFEGALIWCKIGFSPLLMCSK
jgi:hypothetical protein